MKYYTDLAFLIELRDTHESTLDTFFCADYKAWFHYRVSQMGVYFTRDQLAVLTMPELVSLSSK